MKLVQKHPSLVTSIAHVSPPAIAILCALGATLMSAGDARAETTPVIAIDITHDALDTTDTPGTFAGNPAGTGFDFGLGLRSGDLWLYTAELSGGFHDFGGALDPKASRFMLGSRFGIDWTLRPSIFAHLGIGHVSIDSSQTGAPDIGTDWAGDLGLALDVDVVPGVEVGIAGSLNWIGFSDSFEWFQAGAHVTFVLGG